MRLIHLLPMAVICGATGTQQSTAIAAQATLHQPAVTTGGWGIIESVDCMIYNQLGTLVSNGQSPPRVETRFKVKDLGAETSNAPSHPNGVPHGGTPNHSQTQRIGFAKSQFVVPGAMQAGHSLIRLDAAQLKDTMAKHHVAPGLKFKPDVYRFQVFNGEPSDITAERAATSPSFDLSAAKLGSGKLFLAVSLTSSTPPAPTWVVVIRATAANHRYEAPQLVCTLSP